MAQRMGCACWLIELDRQVIGLNTLAESEPELLTPSRVARLVSGLVDDADGVALEVMPCLTAAGAARLVSRARPATFKARAVAEAMNRWKLTAREAQVFKLVVEGHTGPRIAALLGISPNTVRVNTTALRFKSECRTAVEMVGKLLAMGE